VLCTAPDLLALLDWLGWLVFDRIAAADRCSLAEAARRSDRARLAVCADHELIPAGSGRLGSPPALGSLAAISGRGLTVLSPSRRSAAAARCRSSAVLALSMRPSTRAARG